MIQVVTLKCIHYNVIENYFGLNAIDYSNIFKSGTEYLNAFLNTSECCTLYVKNTDTNTLEANDKIVSKSKIL